MQNDIRLLLSIQPCDIRLLGQIKILPPRNENLVIPFGLKLFDDKAAKKPGSARHYDSISLGDAHAI